MVSRVNGTGAFAFDLEGTCVNLEPLHFLAWEMATQSCGLRLTAIEITEMPGVLGGGDPYIADLLDTRYQVSAVRLLASKNQHFDALLGDSPMVPRDGVVDFIETVRVRGSHAAIGSLTARARGMHILKRSGLGRLFCSDMVVFREDVSMPKPDPAVYLETARRAGVHPEHQTVFEDSPVGIAAAHAAGSEAVAMPVPVFQEGHHMEKLRNAGAVRIFCNWADALRWLAHGGT